MRSACVNCSHPSTSYVDTTDFPRVLTWMVLSGVHAEIRRGPAPPVQQLNWNAPLQFLSGSRSTRLGRRKRIVVRILTRDRGARSTLLEACYDAARQEDAACKVMSQRVAQKVISSPGAFVPTSVF